MSIDSQPDSQTDVRVYGNMGSSAAFTSAILHLHLRSDGMAPQVRCVVWQESDLNSAESLGNETLP